MPDERWVLKAANTRMRKATALAERIDSKRKAGSVATSIMAIFAGANLIFISTTATGWSPWVRLLTFGFGMAIALTMPFGLLRKWLRKP